jgi:lipid II:glycine glycyltransferase (peptidoglycan interpeptide bridge formation enzyme)
MLDNLSISKFSHQQVVCIYLKHLFPYRSDRSSFLIFIKPYLNSINFVASDEKVVVNNKILSMWKEVV